MSRDPRGDRKFKERITCLRSQAERRSRPLSLASEGGQADDALSLYAACLGELERQLAEKVIRLEEQACEDRIWAIRLRYIEGLRGGRWRGGRAIAVSTVQKPTKRRWKRYAPMRHFSVIKYKLKG